MGHLSTFVQTNVWMLLVYLHRLISVRKDQLILTHGNFNTELSSHCACVVSPARPTPPLLFIMLSKHGIRERGGVGLTGGYYMYCRWVDYLSLDVDWLWDMITLLKLHTHVRTLTCHSEAYDM